MKLESVKLLFNLLLTVLQALTKNVVVSTVFFAVYTDCKYVV